MRLLLLFLILVFIQPMAFTQTYTGSPKKIQQILEAAPKLSEHLMNKEYEKLRDVYTEDAKIFPGDRKIISGSDAVMAYWDIPEDIHIFYHKVTPVEIKVLGKEAYDYGYYEGKTRQADGSVSEWKGKYVIVWKRVGKEWKIYLDIWNRVKDE